MSESIMAAWHLIMTSLLLFSCSLISKWILTVSGSPRRRAIAAIASWKRPRRASHVGLSGDRHKAMKASAGRTVDRWATDRHGRAPPSAYTYNTPSEYATNGVPIINPLSLGSEISPKYTCKKISSYSFLFITSLKHRWEGNKRVLFSLERLK